MPANPRFLSVSLADTSRHNLFALLVAIDPSFRERVMFVQIQFSPDAQSARLYIGNDDLDRTQSPPIAGVILFAGQAHVINPVDRDWLLLSQIWLQTDIAPNSALVEVGVL